MSTDDPTTSPPSWTNVPPFPKAEAAKHIVRNEIDLAFCMLVLLGRRPRKIPGAYWLWLSAWSNPRILCLRFAAGAWLLGMVANTLTCLGSWRTLITGTRVSTTATVVVSLGLLVALPLAYLGRKTKLHFSRHVLEHEGLVCFDCDYLLRGLPDEHRCPECNAPYKYRALQERWLQWMKDPKKP